MDGLSIDELQNLLVNRETKTVELKESPILDDTEELLQQLSAFSNRDGGHVLFGVRDDGSLEGATINGEEYAEKITNLARDRTSPQAEVHHKLYSGPDGTVLAVRVSKRVGMPVAIVRRAGHEPEVKGRATSTGNGRPIHVGVILDQLLILYSVNCTWKKEDTSQPTRHIFE